MFAKYSDLPEPKPCAIPAGIRAIAEAHARDFESRVKAIHASRGCQTWETWTAPERDQNGHKFTATWLGCRACHVQILQPETADVR